MIIFELPVSQVPLSSSHRETIQSTLDANEIIVYPTDTLYGLGADASSKEAVAKLYALKERQDSPVSVLLESKEQLLDLSKGLTDSAIRLIQQFLPGALTVICHSTYPFAPQLVSGKGTVGLRVPADGISTQLPQILGRPVTTTSVNPAGQPPAMSREDVEAYFGDRIPLMLDCGPNPGSRGSTVIDLTTSPFKILREGEISRSELKEFLN